MNEKKIYQEFCLDLTKKYLDELSGNGEKDDYIYEIRPTEKIAIGILDSGINNDEATRYTSMPMIKVQFYVDSYEAGELSLNLKGNLYYNVLPTYQEQLEYAKKCEDIIKKQDLTGLDEEEQKVFYQNEFLPKFKRVKIDSIIKDIIINKKELMNNGKVDFSSQINNKLFSSIDLSDAVFYNERNIINDALESEEKYNKYIVEHFGNSDQQIFKANLKWEFSGYATFEKTKDENKNVITIVIENKTEKSDSYYAKDFELKKYCVPLFNSGLEIEARNGLNFEEITLDNFEKTYKADSSIKAKGEWLSAECVGNKIITKNVPIYIEKRLLTNDAFIDNASVLNLQKEPEENLRKILSGMKEYYDKIASLNTDNKEYINDVKKFKFEIKRFERGLKILEDPDFSNVRKAFILMNKTFENSFPSWRLFQIVFIVSMISDIVYNDNPDLLESELYNYAESEEAEIIYFPTGGGKTEAFLGTVVLSCFYDRLCGKNYGVNTIIKYPLRLLSIQQLDRTFGVIYKANNVMKNDDELKSCEPLSLGYFVGQSNTPNKIDETDVPKIIERKKDFTLIDTCPSCSGKIDIRFNEDSRVLEHYCTECGYVLPLYIVDDEIYRFLPSVIISTVDKLATITFKDEFRNILGASNYRCPKHGFSYKRTCSCNINDEMYDVYQNQKSSLAPTLFIQDEVHLLKESLGVFSSHYESLMEMIIKESLGSDHSKKIKYIGATATISGADNLVKELYGKECRIFPSPSTHKDGSNFYAYISPDEVSRIILGYAPFGDSINARIEYSVSTLRLILHEMYNNPSKYNEKYNLTEEEFKKMIFYYWTTIIYTRSKKDNNNLRNTFEQQANSGRLIDIEDSTFNIVRMTGDEDFSQIKESLNAMSAERNKIVADNLVLATSTISHGVDSKDFNNIFFYGVPSNTAEYIQSYSRVGRTYTGMVIDIIRLAKNRDVSFLKYFNMMHKYKDYLIDENRLNSKSIIAMHHTFPGIFISILRHHYGFVKGKNYETLGQVDKMFFPNGSIDSNVINDVFIHLCKVYRCENVNSESSIDAEFKKDLKRELITVIKNLHQNLNNGFSSNQKITENIAAFTIDSYRSMTSLRDVDKTYEISIKFRGEQNEEE